MAAAKVWKIKSATFASSAIGGVQSVTASKGGQSVDLTQAATSAVTAVFVDAVAADITVSFTDLEWLESHEPGDAGSLVLVYEQREEGDGAVGAGDRTATYANAVLISASDDAGHQGLSAGSVTFRCSAPSAATPVAYT